MSQNEREDANSVFNDNTITGLLIAGGAGLVIGSIFGTRAIKRTIKIVLIRMIVKKILGQIA